MQTRDPDYMGVAYHERWKIAQNKHKQLKILVPKPGSMTYIAERSGIVGEPIGEGKLLVHFEGWKNGAMQYAHLDPKGQWAAGVTHAAGRALTEYPTVAKSIVDEDDFIEVGAYHCSNNTEEDRIRVWNDAAIDLYLS